MPSRTDLLAAARWECTHVDPDAVTTPDGLDGVTAEWFPASAPGTAVGALRAAGRWSWTDDDQVLLDGRDWWWRTSLPPGEGPGPWHLELGGLATLAEVWVDGRLVLRSDNMHLAHRVLIDQAAAPASVAIRFLALDPVLAQRRPRPRWRSKLVRHQNLRWVRTTPLGRIPGWSFSGAPVGPWRPVRLRPLDQLGVVDVDLLATPDGDGGSVEVHLGLLGHPGGACTAVVGGVAAALEVTAPSGWAPAQLRGTVRLPSVERWWPHTHGEPVRYPVELEVGGERVPLGHVGFRTIEADRSDDGFRLLVNGHEVFSRGVCWVPPDATGLAATPDEVRASLTMARDAGLNMIRVGGYTTYEDETFWDACDELGLMVWQDCMLASVDPPEDAEWLAGLEREVRQVLGGLRRRPALAVVSGSSETHQQAAMYGVPLDRITSTALDTTIPAVAAELLPGVPYTPSSPTGGPLPFDPSRGIAHYFGVGAYQRPVSDASTAGVRFAAECLAFATPPEPVTVERYFGHAGVAGHHPAWKAGVARDSDTSWDFEDVRDHYVRTVHGVDPYAVRYEDPERALDLGRAVVAELVEQVLGGWRPRSSGCAGALVLDWQDVYPGAGWGLRDVDGRPKAPWYPLRRAMAPVAVLLRDEGFAGLGITVVNDAAAGLSGELALQLYTAFGDPADRATMPIELLARTELSVNAATLLNGFRDLTHAYRFGPPAYDVVVATLQVGGATVSEAFHLPGGAGRPVEPDLGLVATARPAPRGWWDVTVSTRRFAQWVRLDAPGFVASDSWFHLAPGGQRVLTLQPLLGAGADRRPSGAGADRRPSGAVTALNLASSVPVRIEQT